MAFAHTGGSSLFPAYSTKADPELSTPSTSADLHRGRYEGSDGHWLSNTSYSTKACEKLDEIQTEINDGDRLDDQRYRYERIPEKSQETDESTSASVRYKAEKRLKEENEERSERKHKKKKKHKERREENERPDSPIKEAVVIKMPSVFSGKGKIFLDDFRDLAPDDAFRLDRSADSDNWSYESLYRTHVSKYHRLVDWSICEKYADRVNVAKKSHKKKPTINDGRYYAKDCVRFVHRQADVVGLKSDKSNLESSESTVNPSFVSLGDSETKTPYREVGNLRSLGVYDAVTELYMDGKAPDVKDEPEIERDWFLTKTAEFNSKLRENPQNIELWLEYVKFQDKNEPDSKDTKSLKPNYRQIIEKKIAILDRAIKLNSKCIKLKVEKINLNVLIADHDSIAKDWENLLFTHSGNGEVWKRYLLFTQCQLNTFTVSKVVDAYHRCFKTISAIIDGNVQSLDVSDDLSKHRLGLYYVD